VLVASPVPLSKQLSGYVALTKPRIIELLLVTTVPAMVLAAGAWPSTWLVLATVIGGTLSAGGANAINMYIDRDIDAVMRRTKDRPLVTGVVTPRGAITFAVAIEAIAFVWLWVLVNPLSALLALGACLFYVFVYTLWLKRTSSQNIVIGGAAGAAPVLIGWAAVTNSLSWSAFLLFAVVFFWTPPHFWALAIKYRDDYSAVDVPMLPSVRSLHESAVQIVGYTLVVWVTSLALAPVASLGWIYAATALVTGGMFTWLSVKVLRDPNPGRAMRLFSFSVTYLVVLFGAIIVDVLAR
jgi:protoheme IX farnesyltransferase